MSCRLCLIVDDEPAIRDFLRSTLEKCGLQIIEADTAPQAFVTVQKLGGNVDLIISDIRMPGDMDGLDLAHSIRNSFPRIPVLLISGYPEEAAMMAAGFPFVPKPFAVATILEAVEKLIGGGTRTDAAGR